MFWLRELALRLLPPLASRCVSPAGGAGLLFVLYALLASLLLSSGCSHLTAGSLASVHFRSYLRRSTMYLSVRLLLLVFFPYVGNAHGVCG